jgi:hypothetical protein
MFAKFELRGGIEEYAQVAQRLLSVDGKFVVAFWHRDYSRVEDACRAASLRVHSRVDVFMGSAGAAVPHLSVFTVRHSDSRTQALQNSYEVSTLDLTRTQSNQLGTTYRDIQASLQMKPRPLKARANKI